MNKEKKIKLDAKLVMAIEEVSYNFNDKFCIDTNEIADYEIATEDCLTNTQLFALYLQAKGYGNVKQAKKDMAKLIFKKMYDLVSRETDCTITINAADVKAIAKRME